MVWCIAEEKILVVVPVQSILLIPLRVSQVGGFKIQAIWRNTGIGDEVLLQKKNWSCVFEYRRRW